MAIVRYVLDPNNPPRLSAEEQAHLDALTPEQIEQNALDDPDNPPSTEEELDRGVKGRFVRLTRQHLGLSQAAFAERYHIGLSRLRDWEQGRFAPDSLALAYLAVIARAPNVVDRALKPEGVNSKLLGGAKMRKRINEGETETPFAVSWGHEEKYELFDNIDAAYDFIDKYKHRGPVWLSEIGTYQTESGNSIRDWVYFWWNEAADWGELPVHPSKTERQGYPDGAASRFVTYIPFK